MDNFFGMTGVLEPKDHPGLTEEAKAELFEILKVKLKDKQKIDLLIDEIEHAVKTYRASRALLNHTRPAEVRARLKETREAALALGKRLNALDGQSLWLLQQGGTDPVARMRSEISHCLQTLSQASKAIGSHHRRGRLPDIPKRVLVAQIAHLLRTHSNIKPTASVDGPFESIIRVVVGSIIAVEKGKKIRSAKISVHDLVLQGLKVKVTEHGRAPEFDPWVE